MHEVFGGWGRRAVHPQLFRQLARTHDDRIDRSQTSWACRTFTTYHAQRISLMVNYYSTDEIIFRSQAAQHATGAGHHHTA